MNELDIRQQQQLKDAFEQADRFVLKNYVTELSSYDVVPIGKGLVQLQVSEITRLYRLDKIVYDKNENTVDKLSSVYHALSGNKGSLIMVIHSDGKQNEFYIGTKADPNPGVVHSTQKTLERAFTGNFPGSTLINVPEKQIEALVDKVFQTDLEYSLNTISSVSGIASLRDEDKKQFVQGMEKLMDAMRGEVFTAIYIADPISQSQLTQIRQGYENLYTQLMPFATTDLSFSSNESQAITEGISSGLSESINESLTKTQSYTESNSTTVNHSESYGRNILSSVWVGLVGGESGTSRSSGTSSSYTNSGSDAETKGSTRTTSKQESKSNTVTEGNSRNLQLKFENKSVVNLLERIDEQLERLKQCEDFGMWNCAAYFIADNAQTARIAATTYKSLMRGTNSSVESSYVNTWDNKNRRNLLQVTEYLKKLHHPIIDITRDRKEKLPFVTPGSLISGYELAIQAGLPRKSVSGLPVLESAEFGRNVITYDQNEGDRSVKLGRIFHMGVPEETEVNIDVDSLVMHTFITGSTGSGKSNTLYHLLDELNHQDVRFLVIEPAKGEYKRVFGGGRDVHVFGTNPQQAPLLRINPFAFPGGVHVLEHLDRLIEIINACWPMYAAMPAVLKEAMERTYEEAGWDLVDSVNYSGFQQFPTFRELLDVLPRIIRDSEYSEEVKSNYTGSLVTRIRSLTNGINGLIFSGHETDNTVLFDANCIVDLSRVGSNETKSLLMGVLVMRLQEYRAVSSTEVNSQLKHVTVLEEAHNLLRRTSQEQSQENANLQGKAVEMLANAIAEMRTYGEGFIIADQSPNLLDMSVIRNTNTKIILRLPDESDRALVGKASNVSDVQLAELSKLKVGVAAVYQNNWLQTVLCQIDRFNDYRPFVYQPPRYSDKQQSRIVLGNLTKLLLAARITEEPVIDRNSIDVVGLTSWLGSESIPLDTKAEIIRNLEQLKREGTMDLWQPNEFESLSSVVSTLYGSKRVLGGGLRATDWDSWGNIIVKRILEKAEFYQRTDLIQSIIQCLLRNESVEDDEAKQFYFKWVEHTTGSVLV